MEKYSLIVLLAGFFVITNAGALSVEEDDDEMEDMVGSTTTMAMAAGSLAYMATGSCTASGCAACAVGLITAIDNYVKAVEKKKLNEKKRQEEFIKVHHEFLTVLERVKVLLQMKCNKQAMEELLNHKFRLCWLTQQTGHHCKPETTIYKTYKAECKFLVDYLQPIPKY